tara:strand:- start:294 stop:491 length:198 start_codon:yes stop_codon:yes gene_type:complete
MKTGELIYIPSKTTLQKISNGAIVKFIKTERPVNALVLEENKNDKVCIHYLGEEWYVSRRDVYDA